MHSPFWFGRVFFLHLDFGVSFSILSLVFECKNCTNALRLAQIILSVFLLRQDAEQKMKNPTLLSVFRKINAHTIYNRTFNHFSTTLFYNVAYFIFRIQLLIFVSLNVTCGWHTHTFFLSNRRRMKKSAVATSNREQHIQLNDVRCIRKMNCRPKIDLACN